MLLKPPGQRLGHELADARAAEQEARMIDKLQVREGETTDLILTCSWNMLPSTWHKSGLQILMAS